MSEITLPILESVKNAMRIDGTDHDGELNELIETAKMLLLEVGVLPNKLIDTDPLIRRAITSYCKAEFGVGDKESERYMWSFEEMRKLLSLLQSYTSSEWSP